MTLFVIDASDWLTSEIPPPAAPETLLLITLPLIVGVPAAKSPTPPPSALLSTLPVIVLFRTWTVPAPRTVTPAPPTPPLQPCWLFCEMTLLRIVAAEKLASTAPLSQKWFPVIVLLSISAGPPEVSIAPSGNPLLPPFRTVKPRRTGVSPVFALIVTTTPAPPPSMIVEPAPETLWTVIAFAWKSIRSRYVPAETL